jgi:hypothetical protein
MTMIARFDPARRSMLRATGVASSDLDNWRALEPAMAPPHRAFPTTLPADAAALWKYVEAGAALIVPLRKAARHTKEWEAARAVGDALRSAGSNSRERTRRISMPSSPTTTGDTYVSTRFVISQLSDETDDLVLQKMASILYHPCSLRLSSLCSFSCSPLAQTTTRRPCQYPT